MKNYKFGKISRVILSAGILLASTGFSVYSKQGDKLYEPLAYEGRAEQTGGGSGLITDFTTPQGASYTAREDYILDESNPGRIILMSYIGTDTDVVIPADLNIKEMSQETFGDRYDITSVVIAHGVETVNGFQCLFALASVTIPDSVTDIGSLAFYRCRNLTSVTIPNSVTNIGGGAFSSCGITSFTIPESVINIERGAFYECSKLTSLRIPENVKSIGDNAFSSCKLLSGVTFDSSVPPRTFGDNVFERCDNLTIYVPAGAKAAYQAVPQLKGRTIIENGAPAINESEGATDKSVALNKKSPALSAFLAANQGKAVEYGISPQADGGVIWQKSNKFTKLKPNTQYYFYVRTKAKGTEAKTNYEPPGEAQFLGKIKTLRNSQPKAPKKPKVLQISDGNKKIPQVFPAEIQLDASVYASAGKEVEFAISAMVYGKAPKPSALADWRSEPKFTGLTPNTQYFIFARYKEIGEQYEPSKPTGALKVTTAKG